MSEEKKRKEEEDQEVNKTRRQPKTMTHPGKPIRVHQNLNRLHKLPKIGREGTGKHVVVQSDDLQLGQSPKGSWERPRETVVGHYEPHKLADSV